MKKWIAAGVMSAFIVSTTSAQQEAAKDEEVQPRVIWGLLIQFAVSKLAGYSWDIFTAWLKNRVPTVTDESKPNVSADSGARVESRSGAPGALARDNTVVGDPPTPISTEAGRENYQGVHIALVAASPDGREFRFRPVNVGFKTGERFKLRVVSTFAGELTIDNINPRGERRHIYPARADQVVLLQPGRETYVPLGKDEFFEFTKATGREQLVITLADPRATGERVSREQVYRQDQKYGSNFLQQVGPNTYSRISQSIELQHLAH